MLKYNKYDSCKNCRADCGNICVLNYTRLIQNGANGVEYMPVGPCPKPRTVQKLNECLAYKLMSSKM